MIRDGRNTIQVEGAVIKFKNFSGHEKQAMMNGRMTIVNEEGKRNFTLVVDPLRSKIWCNDEPVTNPDFGQELADNKFNVSVKPGNDEGDVEYRLPVHIGFDKIPPEIYMICGRKKTQLFEDTIGQLDGVDIISADLTINNGKEYIDRNGNVKVKTWCNRAYFTIAEDRFASKYNFDDIE